eukprot:9389311-Pyramimonas_sp.AAC.1
MRDMVLATEAVVIIGRVPPGALSSLLGLRTWAIMTNEAAFCILDAAYRWMTSFSEEDAWNATRVHVGGFGGTLAGEGLSCGCVGGGFCSGRCGVGHGANEGGAQSWSAAVLDNSSGTSARRRWAGDGRRGRRGRRAH